MSVGGLVGRETLTVAKPSERRRATQAKQQDNVLGLAEEAACDSRKEHSKESVSVCY
jgi:hypothetical protein